jgi:hypothetical protein
VFAAAVLGLLGLLSSVGSVEGVKDSGLGIINMWWVGGICWVVGTVIFFYVEIKIEIERRKRRDSIQGGVPEGDVISIGVAGV